MSPAATTARIALVAAVAVTAALASGAASARDGAGDTAAPWQHQADQLQRKLAPTSAAGLTSASLGAGGGASGGFPGHSPGGYSDGLSSGRFGSRAGASGAGSPWHSQALQLQQRLTGGDQAGASGGDLGSTDTAAPPALSIPPNVAGGINPDSNGNPAVAGISPGVPGASSPYTSTGVASGATPYPQPYHLQYP